MALQKSTIGAMAIAIIFVASTTLAALVATHTISSTGNITVVTPPPPPPASVQLGVYSDSSCTTALSSISWGTLDPGSSTTRTMYLKNEGNVAATLNMTTSNWTPSSTYFTLTWNRESTTLTAGSSIQATLTLNVSSSITGITTFSFSITITATQ